MLWRKRTASEPTAGGRGRRLVRTVLIGVVGFGAIALVALVFSERAVVPRWMAMPMRQAILLVAPARISDVILPAELPAQPPVESGKVRWLDQGWSNIGRFWFHHAPQGTSTLPMPYEWFVALQQPGLAFTGRSHLLSDPEYLRQFGFIPSPRTLQTSEGRLEARYGYRDEEEVEEERVSRAPALASRRKAAEKVPAHLQRRLPENIDGLPVGFARTPGFVNPTTGQPMPDQIGLTCAACHTGELRYRGASVRIDGGQGMVNLLGFQTAMVQAMWYTDKVPGRFRQFAERVLGANHTVADREKLQTEFKWLLGRIRAGKGRIDAILERRGLRDKHIAEGYGRLDALNRIGNQVFHQNLLSAGTTPDEPPAGFDVDDNFSAHTAPVSFPPIWNTPWHLWAQYDASILQPIIRNAGEALGVAARINMTKPNADLWRSSVDVQDLQNIERHLSGPDPWDLSRATKPGFQGLTAPRWVEAASMFQNDPAWAIDEKKVQAGRKLYAEVCLECHLPPVRDPAWKRETGKPDLWDRSTISSKAETGGRYDAEPEGKSPKYWLELEDQRYLMLVEKPAKDIGTDPAMADVLLGRMITLPKHLGVDPAKDMAAHNCGDLPGPDAKQQLPFALALMAVVEKTVKKWFEENEMSEAARRKLIGDRPNCPNKPVKVYRARSLDGMWATAPYLHNGSVPDMWALLSPDPEKDRPVEFCTGSKEFDPKRLGVSTRCEPGMTKLDTRISGNSRRGHEFTADKKPDRVPQNGVVGRKLTEDERWAIIEYLKTL